MSFLERPNISYCKPARKDTVYCRNDSNGEKIFKPRDYLLWTYKEIVGLYNLENELHHTIIQFRQSLVKRNISYQQAVHQKMTAGVKSVRM